MIQGQFQTTKKGLELMAQTVTGEPLLLTRIEVGDGRTETTEELLRMNALKSPKMSYPIHDKLLIRNQDNTRTGEAEIRTVISNQQDRIETGFFMTEIGVYAQHPTEGEILYSIMSDTENPIFVYATESNTFELDLSIRILIGNTPDLKIVYEDSGIYVTQRQFKEALGPGRTFQTIKGNYDLIMDVNERLTLLDIKLLTGTEENVTTIEFSELTDAEEVWGIWDKAERRLIG